jgi:16S rRNA G966 N2-methylase RsmD
VVDTTANVGSDTLRFSQMFKSVDSFEINPENAEALKNNVAVFGAKNVNVFVADSTKEFDWETDVIYADPPWGGPDYYKQKNLDLMMGDVRVDSWLRERIESDEPPKYIILKVPQNYNFARIKSLGVKSSDTKRIGNIVVIFMEVY